MIAYSKRGDELLNKESYEMAISDFTKVINLYREMDGDIYFEFLGSCITAQLGRGIAYERTGRYQQAIDDLSWHSPTHFLRDYMGSDGYIARAIAYTWTGSYRKALDDFYHASIYVNFSMDAEAYFARGYAYKEENWDGSYTGLAIADFEKVIALEPNSQRASVAQQYISELEQ